MRVMSAELDVIKIPIIAIFSNIIIDSKMEYEVSTILLSRYRSARS